PAAQRRFERLSSGHGPDEQTERRHRWHQHGGRDGAGDACGLTPSQPIGGDRQAEADQQSWTGREEHLGFRKKAEPESEARASCCSEDTAPLVDVEAVDGSERQEHAVRELLRVGTYEVVVADPHELSEGKNGEEGEAGAGGGKRASDPAQYAVREHDESGENEKVAHLDRAQTDAEYSEPQ